MRDETAARLERQPPPILPLPERQRPGLPPLPLPLTSLIGRDPVIAHVRDLLSTPGVRLISLIGPGGVGKTRVALQIAADERRDGADVAFLPLAAATDPIAVAAAIAEVVDARHGGDQPAAQRLASAIGSWPLLLVLDNLEQVLPARLLLVDLLSACPNLTFLVTSRTRLRVSGEHAVTIPPLPVPAAMPDPADARIEAFDAAALFVARARANDDAFALSPENAAAVAEICRRLDGLPLAIELAAARIPALAPADIARHLDRSLTLLTGGPHDQPPRLRALRDAIAWSYGLLPPDRQALFRRLAVFPDGFTLDAAEFVREETARRQDGQAARKTLDARRSALGSSFTTHDSRLTSLDSVASLVDSSLVRATVGRDGETRFAMLETVRAFGIEQLAEAGEEAAARADHAAYVLGLAERLEPVLRGRDPWLGSCRLTDEIGNIRAALAWFDGQPDPEPGLRLSTALYWSWPDAVSLRDGQAWIERFLARCEGRISPAARARALRVLADLITWMGDYERCRPLLQEAESLARSAGDRRELANVLRSLGNVELGSEDYARAEAVLTEAGALARAEGDLWNLGVALNFLGIAARATGLHAQSLQHHREALEASRAGGHDVNARTAASGIGLAAVELGKFALAQACLGDVLGHARQRLEYDVTFRALSIAGGIALATRRPPQAVRLLARTLSLHNESSTRGLPATLAQIERWLAAARAALDPETFATAWDSGVSLPVAEALAEAATLSTRAEERAPASKGSAGLSARELDVLRLVAEGISDKEIGARLGISRRTVSKHVQAILTKLDVPSRTAAATYAAHHGLA